MSIEQIIIAMLCYFIVCIALYFGLVNFWRKNKKSSKKPNPNLEGIEMELNAFDSLEIDEKSINDFEIDNPYKDKTTDEFLK